MINGYDSLVWVPENKRDEQWIREVSCQLILNAEKRRSDSKIVSDCRRMYRLGKYNENYDYLYQSVSKKIVEECDGVENERTVTLVPPAKVRHIPIIAPMIRRLVSGEKDRPNVATAYTTDAYNSDNKQDAYINDLNMRQELLMQEKMDAFRSQAMLVEARQRMLMEVDMSDPQAQILVQQLDMELNRIKMVLNRSIQFNEKEMRQIRHYWLYEHKDIQELFAERVVDFFNVHKRLPHIFNRGFEEYLVTGKEMYYADWEPGMEDPIAEQVFFEDVTVPYNEYVNFLHEHSWCVINQYMSMDNIVSTMGNLLTRESMEKLRNGGGMYETRRDNFLTAPDGRVIDQFIIDRQHFASNTSSNLYTVFKTYFKLDTEVYILLSPNTKRKGAPDHIKVLDEDEALHRLEAPDKRLKDGQRIEKRYKQQLYRSTRIGEDIWLNAGLHPLQLKTQDHKSRVQLPLMGHAEHYFYQNTSMIWETKDVQELYNILFYQKELLIVIAGVRGVIMDLSQKPNGMELSELIYYMRQGILPIETLDEDGSPKNSQFNQFGTFDQTISPGIQYIDATLQMLKQLANEITGVSDALMGVVNPTDQVGTSQLSYQNSSLATEHYYQEHEILKEQVLTRLVNLAQFAYKDGKKADFVAGNKTLQRLQIPPNGMDGDFLVVMKNGRKEAQLMQEVQALTRDQYRAGKIQATQLINTLSVDSFVQMRKTLEEYEAVAMEQNQAKLDGDMERMKQVEQMKSDLEMRLQQMVLQQKNSQAELQASIEQAKMQLQERKLQADTAMKMAVAEKQAEAQKYDTDTEAQVEREYLEFNKLELAVNNRNQQAAMLLDTVHKQLDMKKREKVKD